MHQITKLSAAARVLLPAALLAPIAAHADPPHFLSDQFAIPSVQAALPAKKPPLSVLNDHLERLPKTYMVYGLRSSRDGKLICTDRLGRATMIFPTPKTKIIISSASAVTHRKAVHPSPLNTKQSALR